MKKIAITGGIGSGKSSVSKIIRELGYTVIDCDELSRAVTAKGSPLLDVLGKALGSGIVTADGELDRAKTAGLVFSDREKYNILNSLVQTAIKIRMMEEFYRIRLEGLESLVFAEVPLLFEAGWHDYFDSVILVTADEDVRIDRVKKRSNLTEEQVRARMAHQMTDAEKIPLSDIVIDNSGDLEDLENNVIKVCKALVM